MNEGWIKYEAPLYFIQDPVENSISKIPSSKPLSPCDPITQQIQCNATNTMQHNKNNATITMQHILHILHIGKVNKFKKERNKERKKLKKESSLIIYIYIHTRTLLRITYIHYMDNVLSRGEREQIGAGSGENRRLLGRSASAWQASRPACLPARGLPRGLRQAAPPALRACARPALRCGAPDSGSGLRRLDLLWFAFKLVWFFKIRRRIKYACGCELNTPCVH